MITQGDSRVPAALPPRPLHQGVIGEVFVTHDHHDHHDHQNYHNHDNIPMITIHLNLFTVELFARDFLCSPHQHHQNLDSLNHYDHKLPLRLPHHQNRCHQYHDQDEQDHDCHHHHGHAHRPFHHHHHCSALT